MPELLNEISQQELGQRIQNDMPFRGFVKFENNLSIPLEIDPLGTHEIKSPGIGTFGLISVSDSIPMWVNVPETLFYQEEYKVPETLFYQEEYKVHWYGYISNKIRGISILLNMIALSGTNKTDRFSKNGQFPPKLYDGWKGRSQARIKTYKVRSLAKGASDVFSYVGIILDGIGVAKGEISQEKFITNTTASVVMLLLGGWTGFAINLVYLGLDLMGVIDFLLSKLYEIAGPEPDLTPVPVSVSAHHIIRNSYQELLKHPGDTLRVIPIGF